MEAIGVLILFLTFILGCFIAIKTYLKFSTHPLYLIGIYLLGILLGVGVLTINYWHLYRLNSIIVPFTVISGNELKFNFVPKYSGDYSVDITFLNKEMNKKYDSCDFIYSLVNQTIRRTEKDCKNELIYRTINADISNHHFIKKLQYNELESGIDWGFYNHNLKHPALHIYEFHSVKNIVVPVRIKIDATREEIQLAKPTIVIGPLEDAWRNGVILTMGGKAMIFISFALPFILLIILFLFKYIGNYFIKVLSKKL
ncbi:MAG: hypothetical protein A3F11_09685 [Gammaproteobacteria bacterium RIFCSPHIGHO2_12_FULL_37_14]|nr:MAG: hypothetical protein A3F11_09685 [Gammaproteobacteria bacterium RIFCSPHIGHO2_12_FULL_37_14]